jgi:hypothetical protein
VAGLTAGPSSLLADILFKQLQALFFALFYPMSLLLLGLFPARCS